MMLIDFNILKFPKERISESIVIPKQKREGEALHRMPVNVERMKRIRKTTIKQPPM